MKFDIITIFPESLKNYFFSSIIGRAVKKGLIRINLYDLRDWADDKRRTVDDKPFGGGPGMILKIEPIARAMGSILRSSKFQNPNIKQIPKSKYQTRTILLSAKGKLFTQKEARRLARYSQLILICGHYEGVDERVAKHLADEELSIGEYVLTGGELGAAVIVDAVSRLIPGVLGKSESLVEESFSVPGYLEYPQYTRPEIFSFKAKNLKSPAVANQSYAKGFGKARAKAGKQNSKVKIRNKTKRITGRRSLITTWRVPKVLLSGNHKKIQEWRKRHS